MRNILASSSLIYNLKKERGRERGREREKDRDVSTTILRINILRIVKQALKSFGIEIKMKIMGFDRHTI